MYMSMFMHKVYGDSIKYLGPLQPRDGSLDDSPARTVSLRDVQLAYLTVTYSAVEGVVLCRGDRGLVCSLYIILMCICILLVMQLYVVECAYE